MRLKDEFYTLKEFCEIMKISYRTGTRMIKDGRLRVSICNRVHRDEILRFINIKPIVKEL